MENVQQMSLLEVALKIMEEKGTVVNIYDLIKEVLETKGLEDSDNSLAAKLYIDITTSSKFVYMGEGNWDLKSRQSLDEFDKDGASFNPKDAIIDDEEEEEDSYDEDLDEDEDEEDEDSSDDDEEEEEDSSEEDESDDYEDEVEFDDEEDESYDDDSIDEDKYNKIMDDYEDLYEN